jgi:hypothetical protein
MMQVIPSDLTNQSLSPLLSKTIIVPVFLYGCETWHLTVMEEHKLRVSENRVVRRILDMRERKLWEAGEDCITRSFIIYVHQILLGRSNQGG